MKNQLKSYVVIALLSSGISLGAFQLFNLGSKNTLGKFLLHLQTRSRASMSPEIQENLLMQPKNHPCRGSHQN